MPRMCFNVFLFLVIELLVVGVCSLDEQFMNSILDDIYNPEQQGDHTKEFNFISKMWPKITEIVPVSVKIPIFEKNIGADDWPLQSLLLQHSIYRVPFFLCTMETSIEPKVGDIVNINFEKRDDFTNCVVEAKLDFKNPVNFKMYVKDSYEQKSEPVPVSYSFEGQNTVKFWLKIPNFSKEREKITPECIITIDSFSVEKLSKPTINESKYRGHEARKMEKQFWDGVTVEDIYTMMSLGIMKAVSSKLQADTSRTSNNVQKTTKTSWVCLRNLVEHKEENNKKASKSVQRENKTKINYSQLMESFHLGIEQSISSLSSQPQRYVLMKDFTVAEHKTFTSIIPGMTGDKPKFTFITYAPVAFRHLRDFFGMKEETFVATFCRVSLIELSNPGNSGSGLYLSENKYFIAKTVQSSEVTILLRLLPAYVLNLYQNPATLLPKFYGFYWYKQTIKTRLRLLVMKNVMPPNIHINKRYDLKGSTTHRILTEDQLLKPSPTYKDIDFKNHHPQGIYLRADDYKKLMKSIQNDTLMLQSFKIMDYSLLLGVHYEDQAKEKSSDSSMDGKHIPCEPHNDATARNSMLKSGIPAWTGRGEKLAVFVGILDILQTFGLGMKTKHLYRSIKYNGDEYSVHDSAFYANRFENFMRKRVFKMLPPCPAS